MTSIKFSFSIGKCHMCGEFGTLNKQGKCYLCKHFPKRQMDKIRRNAKGMMYESGLRSHWLD